MSDISAADVAAMLDVIDDIAERSDSMPFETAVELRAELESVKRRAHDTVKLLETQMMNQLEDGPRRFGDATYEVVNDGVYRADHDAILEAARERALREAVNPATGEITVSRALEIFTDFVRALYLSPSTSAKVGGIERIGLDKKTARFWENKGRKLAVVDHRGGGGE